MKLTKAAQAAFTAHAIAEFPREACGLVIQHGKGTKYIPCRNVADDPTQEFVLPGEDYSEAEDRGQILAVLHSHTQRTAHISDPDLRAQEETGLPFGILSVIDGKAAEFMMHMPTERRVPLLGREFLLGVLDCYSLVRDLYGATNEEREALGIRGWPLPEGIALPDFPRDAFWERDEELYLENFAKAGFRDADTSELRVGDGILMIYGRKKSGEPVTVVNHAGIYIGDGMFAHHLQGQLSRREVYGGQWLDKTVKIVRYQP